MGSAWRRHPQEYSRSGRSAQPHAQANLRPLSEVRWPSSVTDTGAAWSASAHTDPQKRRRAATQTASARSRWPPAALFPAGLARRRRGSEGGGSASNQRRGISRDSASTDTVASTGSTSALGIAPDATAPACATIISAAAARARAAAWRMGPAGVAPRRRCTSCSTAPAARAGRPGPRRSARASEPNGRARGEAPASMAACQKVAARERARVAARADFERSRPTREAASAPPKVAEPYSQLGPLARLA
mmetsp:Transcript_13858/g.39835  ORF Transcript_13858/g.39835 Transcript_13858/m.39835 type:complete len:248 (+) Transcript_13858:453-1196(+)